MTSFDIGFTPETVDEKLEAAKQEVANSTDHTPGLADAITGLSWKEIFQKLRYCE